MVADRVVLLPGTRVGRRTVMGTGCLGKRDGTYGEGETWIGNGLLFEYFQAHTADFYPQRMGKRFA
jgi:hypothetical protein